MTFNDLDVYIGQRYALCGATLWMI